MVKKKSLLCFILSIVMVITMLPVYNTNAKDEVKKVRLSILTDTHYYADCPDDPGASEFFDYLEASEMRLIRESDAILNEALSKVCASSPDVLLICGDVSSGGEYDNCLAFANKISAAKSNLPQDTGIYVIPGNHDLNNSSGVSFNGTSFERTRRTTADDFRGIFDEFGYNSAYSFYRAEPGADVKNYGGLSYAVEIADGITLIALDTVKYSNDTDALFDQAHLTSGEISDDLLKWAVDEAKKAKEKGNLVIGMSHHGIMPHYDTSNSLAASISKNFVIDNWESVAATLADAGFAAFFTGHDHSNDIAKYVSPNGNTIYDIETSSLVEYPCSYRTVDITIEKTRTETRYLFEINTDFIESIEGIEDFQSYAYEKSSFNPDKISAPAMNLLRPYLYEMKVFESEEYGNGPEGYIRNKLKLAKGVSIDSYFDDQLLAKLNDLIKEKLPFSTQFSLGNVYTLDINYKGMEDRIVTLDVCLSHEENVKPATPVSGSAISMDLIKTKIEEKGTISIDLTRLPKCIKYLKDKLTVILDNEDNWTTDYENVGIFAELSELVDEAAKDILNYEVNPDDDASTLISYVNRIYLGSRHGDEEYVPEEIKAEYEKLFEAFIMDEDLKKALINKAVEYLSDSMYKEYEYPELFNILRSMELAPENESFINIIPDDPSYWTLSLFGMVFSGMNNVENTLTRVLQLFSLGLSLPESVLDKPMTKLADSVTAFYTDDNIPEDLHFIFYYIRQNAVQPEPMPTPPITPAQPEPISYAVPVINKAVPEKPEAPQLDVKDNSSIKVKTVKGQVYSIDGGKLWKLNGEFKGLEENTEYSIITKVSATDNNYESEISEALVVTTDKSGKDEKADDIFTGSNITKEEKAEAKLDMNSGFKANAGKSKVTVKWGEVEGAERYDVYAAYCKKGSKAVKIASVDGDTLSYVIKELDGKPIDTSRNIKVYTIAYRKVGEKFKKIAKSIEAHIAGYRNKVYSNVKEIVLNVSSKKMKTEDTFLIEAKAILKNNSKKMLDHVADFRYVSSDENVATVDENGLVTAKGDGTCVIYVYAQNGYAKKVLVSVE